MQLTSKILLNTSIEQFDALERTLRITNTCCDYMSKIAFECKVFNRFSLQKIAYRTVLETFSSLASQIVIRAFAKVSDAYALEHKILRTFKPLGAISYDGRILSFKLVDKSVNIWSVDGRLKIPFRCGEQQSELLHGKRGEADLCWVDGRFHLFVACEVETPKPIEVAGVLGVDLGIVNIATDSDGQVFSGADIDDNRRKFSHRRRNLQRNGSKSAKRKLKSISGKQSRFQKDTNHRISKYIVRKAQGTNRSIALEEFGGIRDRGTIRRRQRARHANWSFHDLRTKIENKAKRAGVPVALVDPRNTSKMCSACGHSDPSNRPTQSSFKCVRCGFADLADRNAAVNISARAAVMQPMVPALCKEQATPL